MMKEAAAGNSQTGKQEQGEEGGTFCFHRYSPYLSDRITRKISGMNRRCQTAGATGCYLIWLKEPRAVSCKRKKNRQGAAMTTSETIVIWLVWALLLPGLFFGIRAAWRRRKARRQGTEKD